jgi:hypothetical protein
MKVCFIGNSHLSAFRGAEVKKSVELALFGAPNTMMRAIVRQDKRLVAANEKLAEYLAFTSGGQRHIELEAYDRFYLVGLNFGVPDIASIPANYLTTDMRYHERSPHLISPAAFAEAVEGKLRRSLACYLMALVREASSKPITILPTPYVATSVRNKGQWKRLGRNADAILDCYAKAVRVLAKEFDAQLSPQPKATVAHKVFTRQEYMRDTFKLQPGEEKKRSDEDFRHANTAYGEAVLRDLGLVSKRWLDLPRRVMSLPIRG